MILFFISLFLYFFTSLLLSFCSSPSIIGFFVLPSVPVKSRISAVSSTAAGLSPCSILPLHYMLQQSFDKEPTRRRPFSVWRGKGALGCGPGRLSWFRNRSIGHNYPLTFLLLLMA
jgi:hypothetical protein